MTALLAPAAYDHRPNRGVVYCTVTVTLEAKGELVFRFDGDNVPELSSSAIRLGTERYELSTEAQRIAISRDVYEEALALCDPDQQRADAYADEHEEDGR